MQKSSSLKKVLGLAFGIAVGVGGTIGVGILRTPGDIATLLPNAWLMMACWIGGGIFILLSAGTLAEMATMLPKAGGTYNYVELAFGRRAGYLVGWFDFFNNGIAPSFFCIVIAEYLALLFPALSGYEFIIAVSTLVFFTLLHLSNVKTASFIQKVTSFVKVLLFLFLVVAILSYTGIKPKNFSAIANSGIVKAGLALSIFRAMQLVMGTYAGWMSVCFFAEEDNNPGRNIPRSLFIAALLIIGIYALVNYAIFAVVPMQDIAGNKLVAATAAEIVFGSMGGKIVTIISLISIISIMNVYMMVPPRILYALGREKMFIPASTNVNKGGVPVLALLLCSGMSLIFIIIGSFETLFAMSAFLQIIVMAAAYMAHLQLRRSHPQLHRPYKSWGHPFTSIFLILGTVALLVGFAVSDVINFGILIALAGLLLVIYQFFISKTNENVGG